MLSKIGEKNWKKTKLGTAALAINQKRENKIKIEE